MREDNVSVDGDVPALRLFRHRKIRTACEKEGPEGPCRTEKKFLIISATLGMALRMALGLLFRLLLLDLAECFFKGSFNHRLAFVPVLFAREGHGAGSVLIPRETDVFMRNDLVKVNRKSNVFGAVFRFQAIFKADLGSSLRHLAVC